MAYTEVERDPLMTGGRYNPLEYKKFDVTAGTALVAGTALMYDAATDKYIIADSDTITNVSAVDFTGEAVTEVTATNNVGWSILGEDLATSGEALIYVGGSISSDKIVFKGSNMTGINELTKALFRMNGIEVKLEEY